MKKFQTSALCLSVSILSTLSVAEEITAVDQDIAQSDDSTVTYEADYFTQYNPVSANDMLDRIPGIGLALRSSGGGGGRGLGSGAGEVLINGQRMPGKSNEGRSQLGRISADQVDYIEIIRGTSEELGVRGGGQIVNVVLLDMPSLSSTTIELRTDQSQDGNLDHGGQFSYNAQAGDLSYLVALQIDPNYRAMEGREYSYNALRELQETRYETQIREERKIQASSSVSYLFGDSATQFNVLYETQGDTPSTINREINQVEDFSQRREFEDNHRMDDSWEVGGDFEHSFDNGSKYRALFIVNDQDQESSRSRFDVIDGDYQKNLYLLNQERNRERIGRTSYIWNLGGTQGMEVGIEGAQTIRDSNLRLGENTAGTPSADHGGLVPQSVSNSTSTVEEIRFEPFAVHNWRINDRMSLESSVIVEKSTIEQTGDVLNKRDFQFVKPTIDYRFDITNSLQLRANIRKGVDQLSFSDFAATVDSSDDDQNTQAGNPDIRQEQYWRYELNLEMRLPDDLGVVNSQFWYRDLEDIIGRVDVSPDEDNLQSARGNIGEGIRYGMNLDLSTQLSMIGLPNALLTTGLRLRDSEAVDPFLNQERRMDSNGRWETSIGFRHDITRLGLTYGMDYNTQSNGGSGRTVIDIIDTETRVEQPFMKAFVEKKAFGNVTFRLESNNMSDKEWCRVRTRYVGATANGMVEEIEDYCNGGGMELAFKVRSTF